MTQSDLASKTGYSDKSMIAKIEKGLVDLPQSKILLFASKLGVSASDLMGWNDEIYPYDEIYPRIIELVVKQKLKLSSLVKELELDSEFLAHWKNGIEPTKEDLEKLQII